jgi:hypothetical protein
VHRVRGDLNQARAAYELAIAEAGAGGDVQGKVPALAGLARVVAEDDPAGADRLMDQAMAHGPGIGQVEAQLSAGWIVLVRGDRTAAAGWARQALDAARQRSHRPRMAEALELAVLAADRPERETARLAEAGALWRQMGHVLGQLTNAYLRARLAGRPAADVEHPLRVLGSVSAPPGMRPVHCGGWPPATLHPLWRFGPWAGSSSCGTGYRSPPTSGVPGRRGRC